MLFKVYNQDIGKVDNCYIVFCIILCYGGDVANVLVIFTPSVTAYNNGNYNGFDAQNINKIQFNSISKGDVKMKLRKIKLLSSSVLALVLCLAVMFTTIIPPISASATSGNWTGGQVARGYRLKVVYSESQQNPKNNTSLVTATLYLVQDRTYSLYIGTRSATITINGAKLPFPIYPPYKITEM